MVLHLKEHCRAWTVVPDYDLDVSARPDTGPIQGGTCYERDRGAAVKIACKIAGFEPSPKKGV